jgi:hypothetical protein
MFKKSGSYDEWMVIITGQIRSFYKRCRSEEHSCPLDVLVVECLTFPSIEK